MSDEITSHRIPISGSQPVPVPITLAAADFGTNNPADASSGRSTAARGGVLSALGGATAWLNSEPLSAADLRGKIVLVEFWTYTCINWLRTLPCARAWADTYRDQGLVVIGVHAPEFPFEHDLESVRQAARDLGIPHSERNR